MTRNRDRTEAEIKREIRMLKDGRLSWGQTGLLLMQVDATDYWQREARSFTAWVKRLAAELQIQPSVLWRCLGASKFYQGLRSRFDGLVLPPLEDLATRTGPEHLELIHKIALAAPRSLTRSLLKHAIAGKTHRATLRKLWRLYEPAREGVTLRGRRPAGTKRESIPAMPMVERAKAFEAHALHILSVADPAWMDVPNPSFFRIFARTTILLPVPFKTGSSSHKNYQPDLIAVVQGDSASAPDFHAVEVKLAYHPDRWPGATAALMTPYFDFLWLALAEASEGSDTAAALKNLPRHFGILVVGPKNVRVLRAAQRAEDSGSRSGDLAKQLLVHECK